FQAEDGIRDWSVTGVQTCALPIFFDASCELSLTGSFFSAAFFTSIFFSATCFSVAFFSADFFSVVFFSSVFLSAGFLSAGLCSRSEERRVGKEGGQVRARWMYDQI